MRKKRTLSDDHKRKISESQRGKKKNFSPEAIENIRLAAAKRRGIPTGPCSQQTKERIRNATTGKSKVFINEHPNWFKKGKTSSPNPFKKGMVPWNKGKPASPEMRIHLSNLQKGRKQSQEEIEKRRKSLIKDWDKYKVYHRSSAAATRWSKEVRARDGFICQRCFSQPKRLHAHHIKSWKDNEMLRFDLSNGITMCVPCHLLEHKNDESRKLLSSWSKGRKFSEEHRAKLSAAKKGKAPWNKKLRMTVV